MPEELQHIKIEGFRQSGKTYLARLAIVDELLQGRRVLYIADNLALAHDQQDKVLAVLPVVTKRVLRAKGSAEIEIFPVLATDNPGRVWFRGWRSPGRGVSVDTVIADGTEWFGHRWPEIVMPCLAGSKQPRLIETRVPDA
jgi:hypothetical protein